MGLPQCMATRFIVPSSNQSLPHYLVRICRLMSCQVLTQTRIFGLVIYFVCSTISYLFVFDHNTFKHPKYLKNQVRLEIKQTMISMPVMSVLTCPFFVAEVRGYAKLYDTPAEAPFLLYSYLQFPFFLLFTDFWIYLIHRGLHHPRVYKTLHKPHHRSSSPRET
jgi:Delta7-sterol 5-desaturase